MISRITSLTIKSAAVVALAVSIAGSGLTGTHAQNAKERNYLLQQPLPRGGQTEFDPHDPFAPVDLGGSFALAITIGDNRDAGDTGQSDSGWEMPPIPGLPGRPY